MSPPDRKIAHCAETSIQDASTRIRGLCTQLWCLWRACKGHNHHLAKLFWQCRRSQQNAARIHSEILFSCPKCNMPPRRLRSRQLQSRCGRHLLVRHQHMYADLSHTTYIIKLNHSTAISTVPNFEHVCVRCHKSTPTPHVVTPPLRVAIGS